MSPIPTASTSPSLPQHEPNPGSRASALEVRKDTYRFVWDWPAGVATGSYVPDGDTYSKGYVVAALPTYAKIALNYAGLSKLGKKGLRLRGDARNPLEGVDEFGLSRKMFTSFREQAREELSRVRPETWREYADVFQAFERPAVCKHIDDAQRMDRAIAWQRVAGANPMILRQCRVLPDAFPVTQEHYRAALPDDRLDAALREGRLYLADYALLDGVICGVTEGLQKYLAAPFALYAVDPVSQQLRSVCIQPGQDPRQYPIFTPQDGWRWRMANQCVQVADANHHEGVAHLGTTHMVMEAVTVAMKRQLAPQHPLAILLEPHVETTPAINHSAKTSLIAPGGTVDVTFAAKISVFGDLVRGAVQSLSLREANPRADLSARGLMDPEALPTHPYREDAIPVWDATESFVREYVGLYYANDADVVADVELAAFARELAANDGGRLHDVPQPATCEELVSLVTTIVFRASAQHSAVNFPQYPYMGYVPNMAGALYTPAPTADTPDSEADYLAMLPPMKIAIESVTMVYLLSAVSDTQLGHYAATAFSDPRVAPVVARFCAALDELDATIEARDRDRFLPYPFLRPSRILQSISI